MNPDIMPCMHETIFYKTCGHIMSRIFHQGLCCRKNTPEHLWNDNLMLPQGPCHHLEESVPIKSDKTCGWSNAIRMFKHGFPFSLGGWHVQRDPEKVPQEVTRERLMQYRELVRGQDREDNAKRRARNEKQQREWFESADGDRTQGQASRHYAIYAYNDSLDNTALLQVAQASTLDEDKRDCTICHEPLQDPEVRELPCNHSFHRQCIKKWFSTSVSVSCPYCRRENSLRRTPPGDGCPWLPGNMELNVHQPSIMERWLKQENKTRRNIIGP
jgi:hypothetical protein